MSLSALCDGIHWTAITKDIAISQCLISPIRFLLFATLPHVKYCAGVHSYLVPSENIILDIFDWNNFPSPPKMAETLELLEVPSWGVIKIPFPEILSRAIKQKQKSRKDRSAFFGGRGICAPFSGYSESEAGSDSSRLQMGLGILQPVDPGCPTGNGKKLSNSQACCLAQLCLAAA